MIALLHIGSSDAWVTPFAGFRQSLNEAGFVDGRTVTIESRWADRQFDRLPMLTADLLRLHAAVFFANGPPAVRAIRAQSASVPIVFFMGEDPVKEGALLRVSIGQAATSRASRTFKINCLENSSDSYAK